MMWGIFCRRRSALMTLALKSSGPVTLVRPTRSCFTFFQTQSSGLSCGEEAGSTNSFSRLLVEATNSFTSLERSGGVAVDDQVHRPASVGDELAAELDEPGAGEAAGVG